MPADKDETQPETFAELPIQPTGSGVADLEIAYEQMTLASDGADASTATMPTDDAPEAEAHPS